MPATIPASATPAEVHLSLSVERSRRQVDLSQTEARDLTEAERVVHARALMASTLVPVGESEVLSLLADGLTQHRCGIYVTEIFRCRQLNTNLAGLTRYLDLMSV